MLHPATALVLADIIQHLLCLPQVTHTQAGQVEIQAMLLQLLLKVHVRCHHPILNPEGLNH